ncbi:unnamed protein product [Dicrocoelium dendriticum]|nr:unnamed protein product [Dicrocoelium dendriticum]
MSAISALFIVFCAVLIHIEAAIPDNCKLPADPGPCRALLPRFRYDPDQQRCVKFIYGGCRGNRNNFNSLSDCQNECEGK